MTYTAHTNQPIPVLSTVTQLPDPANDDNVTHNLQVKEIPIAPEYKDYWKDKQKVDDSEFVLVEKCYVDNSVIGKYDCASNIFQKEPCECCVAIPKQKQETQEGLWEEIYDVFHSDVFGSDAIKQLKSKYELKRKI